MRLKKASYIMALFCLKVTAIEDPILNKDQKADFFRFLNNKTVPKRINLPKADPSGYFIPTLNRTGYMTTRLDPYSQEFVNYASKSISPVLDIGAAYGVATLAALENGAAVYCNDIEIKHLKIVEELAKQKGFKRLKLVPGSFPRELNFCENKFEAILIARVLHFFDPETLDLSLKLTYKWLKPNGKLFIVADTPYLRNIAKFIPIYERRLKSDEKWPGIMSNPKEYVDNPNFPNFIHWLDIDILKRELLKHGFIIEKIGYINRLDYPPDRRLDGRESVGVIARKPPLK